MAKRFAHVADIGGQLVGYSPVSRPDSPVWSVQFNGPDGKRYRKTTNHEVRGKTPPDQFHTDVTRIIRDIYRPPTLFPELVRKGWDELLTEVEKTAPHTRPETFRCFRYSVKAVREILPEVASPLDMSEERVRRFARIWLATPKANGQKRSPVSLTYLLHGMSMFSNHLIELGYLSRNLWHGVKAPKSERKRKPVPTEDETAAFFRWVARRFPGWTALHALLELKAISGCRTADVCQLKTDQLRDESLTFTADIVKTKEARSLPIPADLFRTLTEVAGEVWLWERVFREMKLYRKQSNGLPPAFKWQTVYGLVTNVFKEYNREHPTARSSTLTGFGVGQSRRWSVLPGQWMRRLWQSAFTRRQPGPTTLTQPKHSRRRT